MAGGKAVGGVGCIANRPGLPGGRLGVHWAFLVPLGKLFSYYNLGVSGALLAKLPLSGSETASDDP